MCLDEAAFAYFEVHRIDFALNKSIFKISKVSP